MSGFFFFFLNLDLYYGKGLTSVCSFQTYYGYSRARPFPFPVYSVMEKGHVLFLCFLLYNIKMYPVPSKEPQGPCFWCRLRPNLVTSQIQRDGGQQAAVDLWRRLSSRSLDESPLKIP